MRPCGCLVLCLPRRHPWTEREHSQAHPGLQAWQPRHKDQGDGGVGCDADAAGGGVGWGGQGSMASALAPRARPLLLLLGTARAPPSPPTPSRARCLHPATGLTRWGTRRRSAAGHGSSASSWRSPWTTSRASDQSPGLASSSASASSHSQTAGCAPTRGEEERGWREAGRSQTPRAAPRAAAAAGARACTRPQRSQR